MTEEDILIKRIDTNRLLHLCLDMLTERERVVLLAIQMGFSCAEIASKLNITGGRVGQIWHYSFRKMHKGLWQISMRTQGKVYFECYEDALEGYALRKHVYRKRKITHNRKGRFHASELP